MSKLFLTDREVADMFGTSRVWPWRKLKTDPTFPHPVRLSTRCVRWRKAEVEAWAQVGNPQPPAAAMQGAA